ncbi:response regulator [Sutterella sp.]|uniref:response regulator n=1 Tax=Sutterella sp. TaxID=1981025 RepID=UPI0026DF916B|nr:response regulator [Sutterella sp.]MDO5530549.1 response regulator [Sutterella sp.]
MSAPLLLIVEDEAAIRELVAFVCEAEGFRTSRAGSIAEARAAYAAERPDLVLLDRMLPDRSGLDWLKELRSSPATAKLPVILLTARGDESDRVTGLDAGADDYIVKPFLPRELAARVRAVLRRHDSGTAAAPQAEETENVIVCGPLRLNEARFEATADGVPLKLSAKEFKLLTLFAARPGRVFSRANLLDQVWPSAFVDERTVDVHMLRLRKALAGTAAEDLIETVRGVGYRCRDVNQQTGSGE